MMSFLLVGVTELASPLRPRSAFRLTGVLPSASRPSQSAFSLILILTPKPKKARYKSRLFIGRSD